MNNNQPFRQKHFNDALAHIEIMKNKAVVSVQDVDYLLDAGFKLSLEFDRVYNSRSKWRARAEEAEAKLK